ncbi:2-amino-4-hydroxy-6-hydroxymethyldihydropteridine diphosphokinase [Alteribacter natronophilus]|uniref:2-amino-4-hydroxy-6- hydroxymethyldihydropteridine diphosphokinase n=1 Tax=Alteribacter natronophilus TaxID=2583810 RepID=UPI00110D2764|nr:2-amino-4-hydroxy-6-hydroxymethyldihydropteridine diphosphokinase [Alteribacter natronophilus]TMW69931.1 2-amino-4-hydroxy-6-hydroxymethyldihydropteridine diphosphokinase [Alteribacter natronophilus]
MGNLNSAVIGIGSNIGDRYRHITSAMKELEQHPEITIEKKSSIYETDPVGYTEQEAFLNAVFRITTGLEAVALLDVLQGVEHELGRRREIRWGPRTIDLDILLYNDENIELERLIVPHPRMHERSFVLIPLKEIEPDLVLPGGCRIDDCIQDLSDKEGVRKWRKSSGADESAPFGS